MGPRGHRQRWVGGVGRKQRECVAQAGQREHRGPSDALMVQDGHVIGPCPVRENLKLLSALVRKEGVEVIGEREAGSLAPIAHSLHLHVGGPVPECSWYRDRLQETGF